MAVIVDGAINDSMVWCWWWRSVHLEGSRHKRACSALYNHLSLSHLDNRALLRHEKRGCGMQRPIRLMYWTAQEFCAILFNTSHFISKVYKMAGLTGSSKVSQNDFSITVTTRPGLSGVPR